MTRDGAAFAVTPGFGLGKPIRLSAQMQTRLLTGRCLDCGHPASGRTRAACDAAVQDHAAYRGAWVMQAGGIDG